MQSQTKSPLFRGALGALTCLAAVLAATPARAQTLTFGSVACSGSGTNDITTPYSESGYTLATPGLNEFATWCSANPNYPGTSALFINTANSTATLTRDGGGAFTLSAIDLAHAFAGAQTAQTLTFSGALLGGGSVSQSFTIPSQTSGAPVFATYAFAPTFTNLASVTFAAQSPPFYQFTNVQLSAVSSVPEPSSIALVATGVLALAGVAARRRVAREA